MTTPTEVAGRYRLDSRLGAGGMSTVFLALDTVLERRVAVKLLAEHLADDEAFVMRFRHEALAAARLQHPNIVQVFDSGSDAASGRQFIVMEYVEGQSCAEKIRGAEPLEIEETVRILEDACHGLDYAHRAGIVHRDVKPGNLLISATTGSAKLADFGIAKAAEQTRITQVGSILGTAAYLSPEQARGEEAGPRSDIYSLGVCAYQFLAARLPHEYNSLTELALKQQRDSVLPVVSLRPDVPPALDQAIRVCLERKPEARYRSALELADALDAGLRGETTEATERLLASTAQMGAPDTDSTRAMSIDAAPTQALARRRPVAEAARPQRRIARAAPPVRRRRLAGLGVALAVLLAGAAVAIAVVAVSDRGRAQPIVQDNVRDQAESLKDLIRRNSE